MRVAVIGASGQLGQDIVKTLLLGNHEVLPFTHTTVDVTDVESLSLIPKVEAIVNASAMHNVEECEANHKQAMEVNAYGVYNLALTARAMDAKLVHISTDYVFNGNRDYPYLETDYPDPLNWYGRSKRKGEEILQHTMEKYFIFRVSALYGQNPCRAKKGLNFVEKMLKLAAEQDTIKVVNDEFVSPTFTQDVAYQIFALLPTDNFGLYHATSEGQCSWYDFAKEIFHSSGIDVNLIPAAPGEFPMKVSRPKYSVLENQGLKDLGLNIFRPWQESLESYLALRG